MPEIEYTKEQTKPSGKKIKKGMRAHVTREMAAKLEKSGDAIVVGSESTRSTQERTSVINNLDNNNKKEKK